GADLEDAPRRGAHMLAQQPGDDRAVEHQRIDMDEIATRMNRPGIVGRQSVEDFGHDVSQRDVLRQGAHQAVRNIMVSVVNPGPNAMPQPSWPAGAFSISAITNITVADDMLPFCLSTSRDIS